jgi:hypothetical protein
MRRHMVLLALDKCTYYDKPSIEKLEKIARGWRGGWSGRKPDYC